MGDENILSQEMIVRQLSDIEKYKHNLEIQKEKINNLCKNQPYNYYINKAGTRFSEYGFNRTISYIREQDCDKQLNLLRRLQAEDFGEIKIPYFEFTRKDNTIFIESDFVKGKPIDLSHMDILYKNLVIRKSDYSITDYNFYNYFIKKGVIYNVDLDSYKLMPQDKRIKAEKDSAAIWDKEWKERAKGRDEWNKYQEKNKKEEAKS